MEEYDVLPFKKILCPTDFSKASRAGVAAASELAEAFKAGLHFVHVVPVMPPGPPDPNFVFRVPEYELALHADAERQLDGLVREETAKGVPAQTSVGHGDAGLEIVRLAQDEGADLIVIATHGSTGWRRVMFGSVAEKVVRLAQQPVLVVPALKDE